MTVDDAAQICIAVDTGFDELLSLRKWLTDDDAFRGRVELRRLAPEPGHMGAVLDTIAVAAGSGGAVTALIGSLTVWMRSRGTKISMKITRGDRSVTITGDRVRAAELAKLQEMAAEIARALDAE